MRCIFCGKEIKGYGNNPEPVERVGKCCDSCNLSIVVPARMELLKDIWRVNNGREN